MTKTLLVDTNRAAVPIYQALCQLGHDVCVVGGKSSETLAKMARADYVELDYSDVERLKDFIESNQFDYLVPGCTDLSYSVCAQVNRGRFPGIDSAANTNAINKKNEFRLVAQRLGMPVPRVFSLKHAMDHGIVIVKPVDSFSGRGIQILHNPDFDTLKEAYDAASRCSKTGTALIEEFISGQLYSHSAFLWNGEIVADFIVQEDCVASRFAVDTSRVAVSFPNDVLCAIRNDICRLASDLQLSNGLMHTQFILSGTNYWIIEMTRRCPGDLYSLLIEFSTGYPYARSYLASFLGRQPEPQKSYEINNHIIRHTACSKVEKTLWGFQTSRPVKIHLFVPLAIAGDQLPCGPDGRSGLFFFCTDSLHEQDHLYDELLSGELLNYK